MEVLDEMAMMGPYEIEWCTIVWFEVQRHLRTSSV